MMKLGGYVHCTKVSHEFECQSQSSRSSGTKKNEKVRHFLGAVLGGASTPVGKSEHAVFMSCISYFLIMAALCNRAGHYIFALRFLLSIYLFSSPNLSRLRLDVCHSSTHGVALVRI